MPVPVCRTVQDAYEAGRADALAEAPAAIPELAAKVAELIAPWLEQIAAQRGPKLLTIAQAAEQLGMSARGTYELMYKGHLSSVEIPSTGTSDRKSRRIEQAEVDAFIARHRVGPITTRGGRNW
jgi:excisionase family DNA binding protein